MKTFLQTLLYVSLSAGILAIVLFMVRLILRKAGAPKRWIVLLWALLAVRLLIPVSIPVSFSPLPGATDMETLIPSEEIVAEPDLPLNTNPGSYPLDAPNETGAANVSPAPVDTPRENTAEHSGSFLESLPTILFIIYLSGIAGMLLYFAFSFFRLKKRVQIAIPLAGEEHVFLSDHIKTAFVLGIVRPRIYLPEDISEKYLSEVLLHERIHIARRDPLWKLLAFLLLSLNWFNPFVWLSYFLFSKDVEFACDEKALENMNSEETRLYAEALVSFGGERMSIAACPVAFGECGIKARVIALFQKRKPVVVMVIAAVLIVVTVSACLFTSRGTEPQDAPNGSEAAEQSSSASEETQPTEAPSPLSKYDINQDGFLQTAEFPIPTGEEFSMPETYRAIYALWSEQLRSGLEKDLWTQSYVELFGDEAERFPYRFVLPYLQVLYSYKDEQRNKCYLCRVGYSLFNALGKAADQFPENVSMETITGASVKLRENDAVRTYYDGAEKGASYLALYQCNSKGEFVSWSVLTPGQDLIEGKLTPGIFDDAKNADELAKLYEEALKKREELIRGMCGDNADLAETLIQRLEYKGSYEFYMRGDSRELLQYIDYYFS